MPLTPQQMAEYQMSMRDSSLRPQVQSRVQMPPGEINIPVEQRGQAQPPNMAVPPLPQARQPNAPVEPPSLMDVIKMSLQSVANSGSANVPGLPSTNSGGVNVPGMPSTSSGGASIPGMPNTKAPVPNTGPQDPRPVPLAMPLNPMVGPQNPPIGNLPPAINMESSAEFQDKLLRPLGDAIGPGIDALLEVLGMGRSTPTSVPSVTPPPVPVQRQGQGQGNPKEAAQRAIYAMGSKQGQDQLKQYVIQAAPDQATADKALEVFKGKEMTGFIGGVLMALAAGKDPGEAMAYGAVSVASGLESARSQQEAQQQLESDRTKQSFDTQMSVVEQNRKMADTESLMKHRKETALTGRINANRPRDKKEEVSGKDRVNMIQYLALMKDNGMEDAAITAQLDNFTSKFNLSLEDADEIRMTAMSRASR